MSKVKVKIITPEKLFLEEEVEQVVVPAVDGEIGFLPGHVPFASTINEGEIRFFDGDKATKSTKVSSGFVDFSDDVCKIIVDQVL